MLHLDPSVAGLEADVCLHGVPGGTVSNGSGGGAQDRAAQSLHLDPSVAGRVPGSLWRLAFASAPAFAFDAQTSACPKLCATGLRILNCTPAFAFAAQIFAFPKPCDMGLRTASATRVLHLGPSVARLGHEFQWSV